MSDSERRHEANNQYLASAMRWLRLRLLALRADGNRAGSAKTTTNDDLTRAAAELVDREQDEPALPLVQLSRRFGLTRFEREVLLLCAAADLDTRIGPLCAQAQDDPARPFPTFALALALFDEPAWGALSPHRPLRYWRLIEVQHAGLTPFIASPLRADERVLHFLKGLNVLDDRLVPLLATWESAERPAGLPPSQAAVAEAAVAHLNARLGEAAPVIQLLGSDGPSKRMVAWQAGARLGLEPLRLPVEMLPGQAGELEVLARLWEREAALLPLALYLDADDTAAAPEGPAALVRRFLDRCTGVVFLATRESWMLGSRPAVNLEVRKPTALEQRAAWTAALGPDADGCPDRLASQFNLNLPLIAQITHHVQAGPMAESLADRLWEGCLAGARPRLGPLAQRIEPAADWDDLVLADAEKSLLRQITDQVRRRGTVYDTWGFRRVLSRGLGISALFAGESGTGKTMAAEVLARELRLLLYRVDLSAVVSKYIGETEKNLCRLFDAAEDGGVCLLFDEADALFGKRSEVKDSHDRYANIEVNYLLQRMEAFQGLAILATNRKSALDAAFLRRLRFVVNFPFPGAAERREIWRRSFPREDPDRRLPGTPTRDLDFDRLARLNLSGGTIRNVCLNAAFLAARDGTPVTMPLLLSAARTEFRKHGWPTVEADLHWPPPAERGQG